MYTKAALSTFFNIKQLTNMPENLYVVGKISYPILNYLRGLCILKSVYDEW